MLIVLDRVWPPVLIFFATKGFHGMEAAFLEAPKEASFTIRPETITQIIRKQVFCVADVRAIRNSIPTQVTCVCIWRVRRKYLMKAPNYTKEFLPGRRV